MSKSVREIYEKWIENAWDSNETPWCLRYAMHMRSVLDRFDDLTKSQP